MVHEYTLKIQNDYSWLITSDGKIKRKLFEKLRVRERGYFHSALYKQNIWDGYIEFFKEDGGRFLTGLLPEVLAALREENIKVKIHETREFFPWLHTNIDENFLNQFVPKSMKEFSLYDYQVDSINCVLRNYRGIVKFPTGGGKTAIMIGILKALQPKTPVLFLTKGASLVEQNYAEMKEWGIENVGRIYGKYKEPNFITCATTSKMTLEKLEPILPKFKVLIVDEVHDCMSPVPRKAYKKMHNAVARIGISATPYKHGGKDFTQKMYLRGFFGGILKTSTTESGVVTTKDLQAREILSSSNCTFYPIKHPQIPHEPYIDAVTLGIAENYYFAQQVQKLVGKLHGRTLVLVDRIKQGELLSQLIPNSYWIKGPTDLTERSKVFQQLKYGDNAVAIVMQQIVSAGINVFIHNLVNAAGGKAQHSIIQRFGRGLRTAEDKETLQYYDFIFDINTYLYKHSLLRMKTLQTEGHNVKIEIL